MLDVERFINMLRATDTGDKLFNPYRDVCIEMDKVIAPDVRSWNLEDLLGTIDRFEDILVGEAPGYRGCRKTGIAFTDEITIKKAQEIYGVKFLQATVLGDSKEASATFVWDVLEKLKNPPLMWNIIPFHPHELGKPYTNRTPNKRDYNISRQIIRYFFMNTEFKRYFAIGRQAEKKLKVLGINPIYIRHPSHGGSNKFKEAMYKYFEVKE